MKRFNTPHGDIKILEPSVELLRTIRAFLPFGIVRYARTQDGADYGIVMQCDDEEVFFVKQQPVECPEEEGYTKIKIHSILIAYSIGPYLRNGFSGLFLPCPYIRDKGERGVESGIAYFGAPSPHGRESQEFPADTSFDKKFGQGFGTMMFKFIDAVAHNACELKTGLFVTIGLDVRPRLHLESLAFSFMIVGPHVVYLRTQAPEDHPVWGILRETGITEVFHMPSVPAGITASQLSTAKPGASKREY